MELRSWKGVKGWAEFGGWQNLEGYKSVKTHQNFGLLGGCLRGRNKWVTAPVAGLKSYLYDVIIIVGLTRMSAIVLMIPYDRISETE